MLAIFAAFDCFIDADYDADTLAAYAVYATAYAMRALFCFVYSAFAPRLCRVALRRVMPPYSACHAAKIFAAADTAAIYAARLRAATPLRHADAQDYF